MQTILTRTRRWLSKANGYHLVSRWRIRGSIEDVYALIANVADYPHWWGDVFLHVERSASDESIGEVRTTGVLPYQIRFRGRLVNGVPLQQISIRTDGDFVGRGTWRLGQDGDHVNVSFDWYVRVRKPLIRRWSVLLKPLFVANHRWTMARGQLQLQAKLDGRSLSRQHLSPEFACDLM